MDDESDQEYIPHKKRRSCKFDTCIMKYILNKFGRQFFTFETKSERMIYAKLIKTDLNETKGMNVGHETIFTKLTQAKKTYLSFRGRPKGQNLPLYNVFQSLGDCIRPEKRKSGQSDCGNSEISSVASQQNIQVNSSIFPANEYDVSHQTVKFQSCCQHQQKLLPAETIDVPINSPITSTNIENANIKSTISLDCRPRGLLFDSKICLKDRMKLFFGDWDRPSIAEHEQQENEKVIGRFEDINGTMNEDNPAIETGADNTMTTLKALNDEYKLLIMKLMKNKEEGLQLKREIMENDMKYKAMVLEKLEKQI